jgi:hypothetical protein
MCGTPTAGLIHYLHSAGRWAVPKLFHLSRAQKWFQFSRSSVLGALAILTLGLLAAHGARAQKVTMEFDRTADFSRYKTFAIRDGRLNSGNPALNSPLVKKQIETDIQNDLTAKGLTMVSSGQPT